MDKRVRRRRQLKRRRRNEVQKGLRRLAPNVTNNVTNVVLQPLGPSKKFLDAGVDVGTWQSLPSDLNSSFSIQQG